MAASGLLSVQVLLKGSAEPLKLDLKRSGPSENIHQREFTKSMLLTSKGVPYGRNTGKDY